ncbi:MAG: hypothetical protein IPM35_13485 [Myxococcales bacterium]|nr:hypothetical protein [Myxococcales bacterium]
MRALAFAAVFSLFGTGCSVTCIEDASGTKCSAKSLVRYDGAPSAPQAFDRAPGTPLTIDVLYGNIDVQRSASGKLEVQFFPFAYAGHDEKALADQQLAQNLRTAAAPNLVTVGREGGSNGLGANVVVRVPDNFDGPLTIVNKGGGPLNNFDLKVQAVGRATALSVTNQSSLGACWIQGAPTVRSTTVQCGAGISLFDVSDEVNLTNTDQSHDGPNPAITVRLAAVNPGSRGGRISTVSGSIAATFPKAGGYVLNAKSPVKGTVQDAAAPPNCQKTGAPNARSVTCGAGPAYEILAGTQPSSLRQTADNNVVLSFQ